MATSIRQLFDAVVAIPEPERDAWLLEHCADPALRAAVQALLSADREASTEGLLRPIAEAGEVETSAGGPAAGTMIGPFVLDQCIGQGGSSSVHRAHRDLDGVRQTVALKLLRRGIAAPESRRQFDRERQALAQLQHPHIAQFIDGGVTADGSAWLALEFVDGVPITTYVRERSVDFRQRIVLMIAVARAVAAAHRRLIVHRDLKPGNVLVSTDGHVKLLDFGIAKLLGDEADGNRTMTRAFTPAYAAPEQREGGPITTATDVYALGILLGELVTGRRLTESGSATPSSQISADTEPGVLPAEAAQTRRLVKGDLDNILLKALDEEPERRYATAEALADDLERLLDGRPVLAHPPSGWYRATKFVQRHRGGVAITALLSIAVLLSLALAIHQGREARAQAELAKREADRSRQVMDYLVSVFAAAAPGTLPEDRPTPAQIVGDAADRLLADAAMSQDNKLVLLSALAKVAAGLGELERAVRLSTELLELTQATEPDNTERILAIRQELADVYIAADRVEDAVAVLSPAESAGPIESPTAAKAVLALARSYTFRGDAALQSRAAQLMNQTFAPAVRAMSISDADRFDLLASEAVFWSNLREFTKSTPLAEAAFKFFDESGMAPTSIVIELSAALAAGASAAGDSAKAIAAYERGVDVAQRLYPEPHPNKAAINALLGSYLIVRRELARAEPLVLEALATRQRLLGPKHNVTLQSLNAAARLRLSQNRSAEADAYLREVIAACAQRIAPTVPCVTASANLGRSLLLQERYDEAEASLAAALALQERISGSDSPFLIFPLFNLTELQQVTGRYDETLATVARIEALAARGDSRAEVLIARSRRAAANLHLGNLQACADEMATVEPEYSAMLPGAIGARGAMLYTRAMCADRLGRAAEARSVARTALGLESVQFDPPKRRALERLAEGQP